MTETLEERFRKAVYLMKYGPRLDFDDSVKLLFYSYYKQATIGDVEGEEPGLFKTEAKAKWNAWRDLQGMAREQAMQEYITLVDDNLAGWENHELLKNVYPATPPRQL
eukprot:jgi/Botrbrau1/4927/Bobra.0122s0009.1